MRVAIAALVVCAAAWAHADRTWDLRMPPGTHHDASGELVAGRGLRDTTDFIAKELARRGIAADQVGPYSVRGVELTRFISRTAQTAWLAVHVMRVAGKTVIFFVARPGP